MQTMVNNTQLFCQAKGVGTGGTMAPILLETVDFAPPIPTFQCTIRYVQLHATITLINYNEALKVYATITFTY